MATSKAWEKFSGVLLILTGLVCAGGSVWWYTHDTPTNRTLLEREWTDGETKKTLAKECTKQLELIADIVEKGGSPPQATSCGQGQAPTSFGGVVTHEPKVITLTGPAEKVFVDSAQNIKRITGGDYKIFVENSSNVAWTSGYVAEASPMSVDDFLSGLRRVHSRGHTGHRVHIEVKPGSTINIET